MPSLLCHALGTRRCPVAAGPGVLWAHKHMRALAGLGAALGMGVHWWGQSGQRMDPVLILSFDPILVLSFDPSVSVVGAEGGGGCAVTGQGAALPCAEMPLGWTGLLGSSE